MQLIKKKEEIKFLVNDITRTNFEQSFQAIANQAPPSFFCFVCRVLWEWQRLHSNILVPLAVLMYPIFFNSRWFPQLLHLIETPLGFLHKITCVSKQFRCKKHRLV